MSQLITFYDQTINKVNEEIEKKKLNHTQKLTERNLKKLFLHFKRTMNLTEKTYKKEKTKKFNYLKFNT